MQDELRIGIAFTCPCAFVDIPPCLVYIGLHWRLMLAPIKSLGQNFLRDENIARKIVDSLHVQPHDIILEIGPGQGDLTRLLLDSSKVVIGVELDPRAASVLKERFGARLLLLQQDILFVKLEDIVKQFGQNICVVGNIPYYITSEILFWLYDQRQWIQHATLMMQSEVASRLVADTGGKAYGILSVFTQLYSDSEVLFRVSRNSFHPRPQVDSAVVRFEFGKPLATVNERLLRNVVRRTFGTRRKTIRNGLRMMGFTETQLGGFKFDLLKRPEQLSPSDFVQLTVLLEPYLSTISMKY